MVQNDAQTIKEAKEQIVKAKEEIKEAKKDVKSIKDAKQEIQEAKQEINEAKGEIKKFGLNARISKEAKQEIRMKFITVLTTAMAVVAAFFWQTAINDTIKTFIPVSGAWEYEIAVAVFITAITAILIYLLSKDM